MKQRTSIKPDSYFREPVWTKEMKDAYYDDDHDAFLAAQFKQDAHPKIQLKKPRRQFKLPTHREQYELLARAVRKDLEEIREFGDEPDQREECDHPFAFSVRMLPFKKANRHRLAALNPWAGVAWRNHLLNAIAEVAPSDPAHFVTVLEEGWDFPSDQWPIDSSELMARLRTIGRQVRNRLRGLPFLLQLDIALHRVAKQPGSRRVCVHFHGLIWGQDDHVSKAMAGFKPGFLGAPGGLSERVYDLRGALAYMSKDPRSAYVSYRKRQPWKPDQPLSRLFSHREPLTRGNRRFLLNLFGDLTKPQLCIASGVGEEVLRRAKALAQAKALPRSARKAKRPAVRKAPPANTVKESAQARAKRVDRVIRRLKAEGITSARGIAKQLNQRQVPSARGGAWTARSVLNVVERLAG